MPLHPPGVIRGRRMAVLMPVLVPVLVPLLVIVAGLAGCSVQPLSPPVTPVDPVTPTPTPSASSKWTVLVYGHGDHNLTNVLAADIIRMSKATLNADMKVLVYADFNESVKSSGTMASNVNKDQLFPKGAFWYRINGSNRYPTLMATETEQDFDQPNVLRTAVRKAFHENPADHYAIVLWDHGGSWRYGFGGDTQGVTRTGPGMKPEAFATAMREGMAAMALI